MAGPTKKKKKKKKCRQEGMEEVRGLTFFSFLFFFLVLPISVVTTHPLRFKNNKKNGREVSSNRL